MKSFLSLVAALAVMAGLAAGGYYLYQQVASSGNAGGGSAGSSGHLMTATSTGASLALTNGTHYVLTVTMKQGAELVRFEIAPGHAQSKSFAAGTYSVDGKISDPDTDPFSTSWTFQDGGQYNATFSRDSQTGQVAALLLAGGQGQGQSQGNQGKPKSQPKPRP